MKSLTPEEVAWLAGLLEGEGCFFRHKTGKRGQYGGAIKVCMTDKDVIEHAARLMNVTPHFIPGMRSLIQKSPQWYAYAGGQKARHSMELILPFMGERRGTRIRSLLAMMNWGFPLSQGSLCRHFNVDQIREIRQRAERGDRISHIADNLGVAWASIQKIVQRETYKWVV